MTINPRVRRGCFTTLMALGLCMSVSCDEDPRPPSAEDGTADGDADADDGDDDDPIDPTTSGNGTTTGQDDDTGNVDDGSGDTTGDELDPNLDRSAPNILDDPNLCGYPGPGPNGYGGIIGQNRFPNFVLEDCEGNQREFAEFFCPREDEDYMDVNKAFIVVFEAMW